MNYQTERLLHAHQILQELKVSEILLPYSPTLAGTVPIGIDIPGSDLDIICEVYDLPGFQDRVVAKFSQMSNFRIKQISIGGIPSVVASFIYGEFPIEIFGQPQTVNQQNAYRHMQIEARLLTIGGEKARKEIKRLKQSGLKTEPAFAHYFCIAGDPYQRLLEIEALSDQDLLQFVQERKNGCVFCDIAASRKEASKVFEDEYTVAFMNLRQANEGHVLVIPKKHYPSICELNDEIASQLLRTVVKVAKAVKQSIKPEGITVWQSNGEAAGQEIDHVHFHVLPRYVDDQVIRFYPDHPQIREREDLERIAEIVREVIQAH
jgi:diadenosine tetraphosphate (Ap4A) HIT family hydrolase